MLTKWFDALVAKMFVEVDPRRSVAYRILLGLNLAFCHLSFLSQFEDRVGLANISGYPTIFASEQGLYVGICLMFLGSLMLILGLFTQPVILLLSFGSVALASHVSEWTAGHDSIVHVALFSLYFMYSGQWLSLDRFIFQRPARQVYQWPFLSLYLIVATVYTVANICRIDSEFWNQGLTVLAVLKNDLYSSFPGLPWENYVPWTSSVLTHIARGTELIGVLLPFLGRYRHWLAVVLFGLHLGLVLLINIHGWQFFMMAIMVTAMPPDWFNFIWSRLGSFEVDRRNRPTQRQRRTVGGLWLSYLVFYIIFAIPAKIIPESLERFRSEIPYVARGFFLSHWAVSVFSDVNFNFRSCVFGLAIEGDKSELLYTDVYNRCWDQAEGPKGELHETIYNALLRKSSDPHFETRVGELVCRKSTFSRPDKVYFIRLGEWARTIEDTEFQGVVRGYLPVVHYSCDAKSKITFDGDIMTRRLKQDHPLFFQKIDADGFLSTNFSDWASRDSK